MIFAKMPTETEISKNETLNISPSPVRNGLMIQRHLLIGSWIEFVMYRVNQWQ